MKSSKNIDSKFKILKLSKLSKNMYSNQRIEKYVSNLEKSSKLLDECVERKFCVFLYEIQKRNLII